MTGCRARGAPLWLVLCCCCWRAASAAASAAAESFAAAGLSSFLPVPSSISPFSAAEELSCGELLLTAWSQQCSQVAAANTIVWRCGSADEAGLLVLAPGSTSKQQQQQQEAASAGSASPAGSTGQHVWRLRIVGPGEIVAPPIQNCPGDVAVAAFRLTSPGQYQAELLLLYDHFAYDGGTRSTHHNGSSGSSAAGAGGSGSLAPQQRPDPLALSFTLRVKSVSPASLACGATDTRSGQRKWCPVCGSSLSSGASSRAASASRLGRWVVKAEDEKSRTLVMQALAHTCFHASPSPSSSSAGKSTNGGQSWSVLSGCSKQLQALAQLQHQQKHESALLAWEPYGCRLRPVSLPAAQACQQRLLQQQHRVCFVGDGQVKHLARRVAHVLGVRMEASNSSGTAGSFHYFATDIFASSSQPISDCSLVFMGADPGAAAAAAAGGRTARSSGDSSSAGGHGDADSSLASRYAARLQQAAAQLLAQRRRQQQQAQHWGQSGVFWVTTSAYPLLRRHTNRHQQQQAGGSGGTHDARSEPYLLLFNKLASSVMGTARIPVLDIYSIARPVVDLLVFEGGRRSLGALVGGAQARLVAGVICPETGSGGSSKSGARGE